MNNFATPGLDRHMAEVDAERQRQLARFGDQHHPDGTGSATDKERADEARRHCDHTTRTGQLTWNDILTEEVCEALAESDLGLLRAELVQVAAVALAWISDLDSRAQSMERCTCGGTACESDLCDCDTIACPVDHAS
ncbi:hypothetical protein ABT357_25480, partial [Streptomyces albidoflavus]